MRKLPRVSSIGVALLIVLAGSGCALPPISDDPTMAQTAVAYRADAPVVVDGQLDDVVWSTSPPYPLQLTADVGTEPVERATVRWAWDDEHLYVAIQCVDADIVQEQAGDQQLFFQTGDVVELFLKPPDGLAYWEIYVTPQSGKACIFMPGRGRLGLDNLAHVSAEGIRLQAAATIDGSLNNWRDTDRGWRAEFAIPWKPLGVASAPLEGQPWSALVARYNYGYRLAWPELTSAPQLSKPAFHAYEEWARLVCQDE